MGLFFAGRENSSKFESHTCTQVHVVMVVYESFLAVLCPWTEPAYMYVQVLSPQKRAQDAAPSPVSYHNPYTGFKSNGGITS